MLPQTQLGQLSAPPPLHTGQFWDIISGANFFPQSEIREIPESLEVVSQIPHQVVSEEEGAKPQLGTDSRKLRLHWRTCTNTNLVKNEKDTELSSSPGTNLSWITGFKPCMSTPIFFWGWEGLDSNSASKEDFCLVRKIPALHNTITRSDRIISASKSHRKHNYDTTRQENEI